MKLPKTYKAILRLLISIAENGNPYYGDLTHDEEMAVGSLIADIQNNLGEINDTLLHRLGLHYDSSI